MNCNAFTTMAAANILVSSKTGISELKDPCMYHFDNVTSTKVAHLFTHSDKCTHPNPGSRETNFRLWAQGTNLQSALSGQVPI